MHNKTKTKLEFFSGFLGKMHKIIFFIPKKNNLKKYLCLPYIKFSDPLPETLIFLFGLAQVLQSLKVDKNLDLRPMSL